MAVAAHCGSYLELSGGEVGSTLSQKWPNRDERT
jgi:hypothetical protein